MVEKYAREAKIEQEHSLQSRKLIFHIKEISWVPEIRKSGHGHRPGQT